jgi:hypothetical protein
MNEYLKKLTEKTITGEVPWSRSSNTVFNWEPNNLSVRSISLQQTKERVRDGATRMLKTVSSYVMVIKSDSDPKGLIISSSEHPQLKGDFDALFEAASNSVVTRAESALRDLLGDL